VKPYRVRANNTAVLSDNKMHDDAVAATYGFAGGLVPGVDVYAYLCHQPTQRWGRAWVERGTMAARFVLPVYDGDQVTIEASPVGHDAMDLVLCGPDETVRATGRATLPEARVEPVERAEWLPLCDRLVADERPPATPEVVAGIDLLRSTDVGFDGTRAHEYLDDIGEQLSLFRDDRVAHPGWLLRQANFVLSDTVRLGPWIHVSSECIHFDSVVDGDRVTTRARIVERYERKGHHFVELDVQWLAGPTGTERMVLRARHVAIYQPRRRGGR
jgi:acyl dehydratase